MRGARRDDTTFELFIDCLTKCCDTAPDGETKTPGIKLISTLVDQDFKIRFHHLTENDCVKFTINFVMMKFNALVWIKNRPAPPTHTSINKINGFSK